MLHTALLFIKQKLDQALMNRFGHEEGKTVLNHLIQQDGGVPEKNQNKMVLSLINLDHETNKAYSGHPYRLNDNNFAQTRPAILFNIDLLFTASFDHYEEALKYLNATIAFFQTIPSFNAKTTPDLPKGIKALNFEVVNFSFSETHNLWSAIGGKYQPSIIYKVRHIQIQDNELQGVIPSVLGVAAQASPKEALSSDIRGVGA